MYPASPRDHSSSTSLMRQPTTWVLLLFVVLVAYSAKDSSRITFASVRFAQICQPAAFQNDYSAHDQRIDPRTGASGTVACPRSI